MGASAMRIKPPSSSPPNVCVCVERIGSVWEKITTRPLTIWGSGLQLWESVYLCATEHLRASFLAMLDAWSYRGVLLHFLECCGRSNLKELWTKNYQPKSGSCWVTLRVLPNKSTTNHADCGSPSLYLEEEGSHPECKHWPTSLLNWQHRTQYVI